MHRTTSMTLGQLFGLPRVDNHRRSTTYRLRSKVRGLTCAILCSVACSCGGGGGSNPPFGMSVSPPPPAGASVLVVTNATSGTIDVLTIDTETGVPTPIAGDPWPDGPAASAIVIDPDKQFLYVSSTSGEVRGYYLTGSPVRLIPISGSPFATSAPTAALAIDPIGQNFVLTANGSANTLSEFRITNLSDGGCGHCVLTWWALTEVMGSPFTAGTDPSAIVITNGYFDEILYAVNTAGRSVSVYHFDNQDDSGFGTFSPVAGSPFPIAGVPNGLVADSTGTRVYITESQPNEVSGFSVANGSLTPIPGSPFPASYSIQSPVIVAEGKRLCAANGTDVDCFLIDSNTGALTETGVSHTNGRAVALALDDPDNFLYALDNVDNQVEVFSINPTDGSMQLIPGSPFALFPGAGSQDLGPNAIAVQR